MTIMCKALSVPTNWLALVDTLLLPGSLGAAETQEGTRALQH